MALVHSELFHGPNVEDADALIARTSCEIVTIQMRRKGEGLDGVFVLMSMEI